jgi:hypothetical protein
MEDYAADARFFTPDGVLRGAAAIQEFFVRLFEEFAKPGVRCQKSIEPVRLMVWESISTSGKPRLTARSMSRRDADRQ